MEWRFWVSRLHWDFCHFSQLLFILRVSRIHRMKGILELYNSVVVFFYGKVHISGRNSAWKKTKELKNVLFFVMDYWDSCNFSRLLRTPCILQNRKMQSILALYNFCVATCYEKTHSSRPILQEQLRNGMKILSQSASLGFLSFFTTSIHPTG